MAPTENVKMGYIERRVLSESYHNKYIQLGMLDDTGQIQQPTNVAWNTGLVSHNLKSGG